MWHSVLLPPLKRVASRWLWQVRQGDCVMFNGASFVVNRSSGGQIRRDLRDPAHAAAGESGQLDLVALRRYISLVEVYGFLGSPIRLRAQLVCRCSCLGYWFLCALNTLHLSGVPPRALWLSRCAHRAPVPSWSCDVPVRGIGFLCTVYFPGGLWLPTFRHICLVKVFGFQQGPAEGLLVCL